MKMYKILARNKGAEKGGAHIHETEISASCPRVAIQKFLTTKPWKWTKSGEIILSWEEQSFEVRAV